MLTLEQRRRVRIVLVRARNPNNIGAVARAMHDFGFGGPAGEALRLVNGYTIPLDAARSAIDASAVLTTAQSCATVAEAVAGCSLVLGTTAIGDRDLQHPVDDLASAAPRIALALAAPPPLLADDRQSQYGSDVQIDSEPDLPSVHHSSPPVALLFGSEKTGLSNEELSHCHRLLTIPMHLAAEASRHASMNLGQAAAVCLYELIRQSSPPSLLEQARLRHAPQPAGAEENERLATLLGDVLDQAGYRNHHPANSGPAELRRLILRMQLSQTDAPVWMGMLRQMLWKIGRGGQKS